MKRFVKVLSLMLATFMAVTVFSVNSCAMSAAGEAHKRQLTTDEIKTIYTIFNAKEYAKMYPDVKNELGEDEMTLFNHFVTFGIWEQRQPSVAFNVDVYASRNPDLQPLYGDDIVGYYIHYVTTRKTEGWRPIPTKTNALWYNCTIYSVYDFVKGQTGPKAGAIPVQTLNYHPGVELQ
ncbi:MAG: hypothetical protein IJJ59_12215 [Pseudobutyrivibrio sp.]|uniref:hypothetical protein n=1 Tax=Pseudobutyrivibrio sp. TaxID=2014367 RepID=UPI0025E032B8|nr:hypothetical protein [Pseudobutyrivibrio sp.]MBQ6464079.1 hypothetical protein [Pseudobutyrivibrio sp.]